MAKIFQGVVFSLGHFPSFDQTEDYFSEVIGLKDAPSLQHRAGEKAPLQKGVLSQSFTKLLAGHMPTDLGVGHFRVDLLDGERQPSAHEVYRIDTKRRLFFNHLFQRFLRMRVWWVFFLRWHAI